MGTPTSAELKLLRALWQNGRLAARELHDATVAETGWSYSTTRKTLDRMAEKGLVSLKPIHGIKTFVAAQPKVKTLAGLINDFAKNVLDADGPLPAAAFAPSRILDPAELDELEALLEAADEEPSP